MPPEPNGASFSVSAKAEETETHMQMVMIVCRRKIKESTEEGTERWKTVKERREKMQEENKSLLLLRLRQGYS
jgi:hypothetical protein